MHDIALTGFAGEIKEEWDVTANKLSINSTSITPH